MIALRKIAQKKESSVSEIIRVFIQEKLEEPRIIRKKSSETLLEAARRIGKMGLSAPKDLAKNMDAYLYGRE